VKFTPNAKVPGMTKELKPPIVRAVVSGGNHFPLSKGFDTSKGRYNKSATIPTP
jgi:hypothetical protein